MSSFAANGALCSSIAALKVKLLYTSHFLFFLTSHHLPLDVDTELSVTRSFCSDELNGLPAASRESI